MVRLSAMNLGGSWFDSAHHPEPVEGLTIGPSIPLKLIGSRS